MWEWLLKETQRVSKFFTMRCDSDFGDTVTSDVLKYFVEHQDEATKIYEKHDKMKLTIIVKRQIYETASQKYYGNSRDYANWCKINEICEKHNITPSRYYAYKIAALCDLSITAIEGLLERQFVQTTPLGTLDTNDIRLESALKTW